MIHLRAGLNLDALVLTTFTVEAIGGLSCIIIFLRSSEIIKKNRE